MSRSAGAFSDKFVSSRYSGMRPTLTFRMPQFRQQLTDQDIAEVTTFIRNGWGNQAAPVAAAQVAKLRKTTDPASDRVIVLRMH